MKALAQVLKRQGGFSLVELMVVVSIMGVLVTMTIIATTGTTTTSKGASKDADTKTISDSVKTYVAEHNHGRQPTLDGCLPGKSLNTLTLTCSTSGGTEAAQQFSVDESEVGVDIDGDGSVTGDSTAVPILWDQFYGETGDGTDRALTTYVSLPKHALDTIGTASAWKSGSTANRTEDGASLRSPDMTACKGFVGTPSGSGDTADCPVWILNEFGEAKALLPDTRY